jgi:BASS family bile acid:Na+ symporter
LILRRITSLFPLWALLLAGLALWQPAWFTHLKPAIIPLLGVVMFGMGMTLTPANFMEVWRRPGVMGLGLALQYSLMPLLAWLVGRLYGLGPELLAGMVLVGASPGGTASNVVCYLARGDLALSISLTTLSTLSAVLATPLLTWVYIGARVPVPVWEMLLSILKVVLLPVLGGLLVNLWIGHRLGPAKRAFPLLSVAAIVLIIAIVVALNQARMLELALGLIFCVVLHNGLGLAGGYWAARLFGCDRRVSRTLAIEVGMQNSGLAVALAGKYLSAAAALPGALFSIWHNLSGAALAAWWSRRPPGEREK